MRSLYSEVVKFGIYCYVVKSKLSSFFRNQADHSNITGVKQ